MSATTTTSAAATIDRSRNNRWERNVPVYGFPVVNGFFLGLAALVLVAFALSGYRELAGLGPVSGMNDAYGWGIWKTFNLMVLTALGSGAFAVGIGAWVFRRKRLHSLMRMAFLHVDLCHDPTGRGEHSTSSRAALVFRFPPAPWSRTH